MRKITKQAEKCSKCGRIIKSVEYEEFCDECEKKIHWKVETGFPFRLDFILHRKGDFAGKDFNFCSAKCMFKWLLKNGKRQLKHSDDFFGLKYWNKKNTDQLFKFLDKKKIKK